MFDDCVRYLIPQIGVGKEPSQSAKNDEKWEEREHKKIGHRRGQVDAVVIEDFVPYLADGVENCVSLFGSAYRRGVIRQTRHIGERHLHLP
jgi:hypothetical protein